jgi:predicted transcriptional regulator
LLRLVERGFLRTEKNGKEREYYPLIAKEDYLKFETQNFLKIYHENSFTSFISTLYNNAEISEKDIEEIIKIVKERGE